MNQRTKGLILGALSAICYGLNPLGALFLYADGLNVCSVLSYRFLGAAAILALIMLIRHSSFRASAAELRLTLSLGVLFAVSAMSLYGSYLFMAAGIASTLLFVYPIVVAIIMAAFFRERISAAVILAIAMAFIGIALLYHNGEGVVLSLPGVVLVTVSALTYALYIVIMNRTKVKMPLARQTFYILIFCALCTVLFSLFMPGEGLRPLPTLRSVFFVAMLAIVPTIASLSLLTAAVNLIGATLTAIMGALEPLTAVVVGIVVFGEPMTVRLFVGIVLIVGAVTLVVADKSATLHHFVERQVKPRLPHRKHSRKRSAGEV